MSPRYTETDKEQAMSDVRQQLINAAIQEFALRGFDGANINNISMNAGFSKGTIYNYFPSKLQLMLTILEEAGAAHFEFMAERIQREEDPILRITRFFEAGFAFVEKDPLRAQLLVSNLYGTHIEFKLRLFQVYQPMFRFVAEEILHPGIVQGVFREVDPVDTSRMIMTIYLGTASSLDKNGKLQLHPSDVASFVINALRDI